MQKPAYKCIFDESVPEEFTNLCTAELICAADPRIKDWSIDWSSEKSLYNWHERLDMMCAPSWKQALLGTALFVGWASTLLWLPRFGDMYGRKWIFAAGMTLNLLMYTIMMVT